MALRHYTNLAPPVPLSVGVNSSDVTLQVASTAGYPSAPFTLGVERGVDAKEEVMLCTAKDATTFTVTRGYDGTVGVSHLATVPIEHCTIAMDYADANAHIFDTTRDDHTQYLRKALLTAKGDLFVATASGVIARVAIGADGAILVADSAQTNGLKWSSVLPAGVMAMYGGSTAPAGWFLCDGSLADQTTDAALFAIVGSTFNTGGESGSQFRLPDLRGRTAIGVGTGSGLSARSRGSRGGEETHLLVLGEIAAHAHGVNDPTHAHADIGTAYGPSFMGSGGVPAFAMDAAGGGSTNAAATGISIQNNGGGGAHNNMQPFLVVNFLIKR